MAAPDFTAGDVMDASAALLNDAALTRFTYGIQIPYLNIALDELQEIFQKNNMPVTDFASAVIEVPAGTTEVTFEPAVPVVGVDYLPDDLIDIKVLWERQAGIDPWIPMTKVDFLPRELEGTEINQFSVFTWNQSINLLEANQDNDLKIDYIRNIFSPAEDETTAFSVLLAKTFLEYRTAALCAQYISQDKSRADELNVGAAGGVDRALGIGTKGRQMITIRRRPFRAAYKRRVFM